MKELAFISQNRIYCLSGGRINELPCGRVIKYKETLADIRRRSEWKTSGSGAAFMGQNIPAADPENVTADISGLACYDGQLVYAVRLDDSGGIYIRSTDRTDMNESLIVSGKEIFPGRMSCQGNKLCISCGENREEKHISVYELPSSFAKELTDGDSIEEAPSMDGERIYFDPKFLEEISRMKEKNLAVELLKRLIAEQVQVYKRTNVVKSEKFSEIMQSAMNRYLNGMLTNEQVIQEMLNLAKQIREANQEGQKLGLSADELAFYDALTKPQAINDCYENEELIAITKELADTLRKNKTIDWHQRDSARAKNAYDDKETAQKAPLPTGRNGRCCTDCYDTMRTVDR